MGKNQGKQIHPYSNQCHAKEDGDRCLTASTTAARWSHSCWSSRNPSLTGFLESLQSQWHPTYKGVQLLCINRLCDVYFILNSWYYLCTWMYNNLHILYYNFLFLPLTCLRLIVFMLVTTFLQNENKYK